MVDTDKAGENAELKMQECRHQLADQTAVTLEQYMASSRCRRYEMDTFVPSLQYDGPDFNHFQGLAIQHKDCKDAPQDEDHMLYRNHLRDEMCNGDEDAFRWCMNFYAAPLQAIEAGRIDDVRQHAACFFLQGQGGGTGTLCHAFSRAYGKYYYKIIEKKDVYDKFNRAMFESLFVELDQTIFAGDNEQANIMKALTTEPTGTKEDKYAKKRKNERRWFNITAPTNSTHAQKVESDGRRDAFFEGSERNTGKPTPEWAAHCKKMQQDKYVLPFLKLLYEWDVHADWWAQASIPQNQALADQKTLSLTPVEHCVKAWLDRGWILPEPQWISSSPHDNRARPGDEGVVVLETQDKTFGPSERVCSMFGQPLPRQYLWEQASSEFGAIRNFPKSSNSFWIHLRKVFRMETSVYVDNDNKKTFRRVKSFELKTLLPKSDAGDDVKVKVDLSPTHIWETKVDRYISISRNLNEARKFWNKSKFQCYEIQ